MRNKGVALLLFFSLLPLPASAGIVISEVMYDVAGSDSKTEWIELHNTGSVAIDISKWKVRDSSNHVLNAAPKNGSRGSMLMQPGAYLILASDAATFDSLFPAVSASVIDTVLSLPNTGASISLSDASSTQLVSASFTKDMGGDGTGESLQLISGVYQPGKPTPGNANASVRIEQPKPVVKTVAAKVPAKKAPASTSKTAVREVPGEAVPEDDSKLVATAAAAAVIPESDSGSMMPWLYAVLALGVGATGAIAVSRHKKSAEWDIEEIY